MTDGTSDAMRTAEEYEQRLKRSAKLVLLISRDDAESLLAAIRFVSDIYAQEDDEFLDMNAALERISKRIRKALEAR